MKPLKGQEVHCFLIDKIQIQGIVIEWTDEISVLKSIGKTSLIVINNTIKNVIFYKILTSNLNEFKEKTIKTTDDIKSIAELKIELNNLEKEEIREKLNSHQPSEFKPVTYGLPSTIFKNSNSLQHSQKEVSRTNNSLAEGLQSMLHKKNK